MKRLLMIVGCGLLWSCAKPVVPAPEAAAEVEPYTLTRWSRATELFVEFAPLRPGTVSRFAIHFTRLDTFRAVTTGVAEVTVQSSGQAAQVFRAEAPSRPGIFGVDVKPAGPGPYQLRIAYRGAGIEDSHDLGTIAGNPPEAAEGIPFLKEQQWVLDFATREIEAKSLQASLRVPAEVTPRTGGLAEVDAPFDGRLLMERLPAIGTRVEAGTVLAQVLLPVNNPNDITGLELARDEAGAQLEFARKDQARAARLVHNGAAPARRLEEAATSLATAEARWRAAQQRLAQFEASRSAQGPTAGVKSFAIRAPIAGLMDAVLAAPGANVKSGDPVFRIVDLDAVHVSAIVPESEFARMRELTGAELEIPGLDAARRLKQLIAIGRVVDAQSRTFPVIYGVDNRDRQVAIHQTVYVRLLFAAGKAAATVPEGALVDDGGSPIVFVQLAGETFARRAVKTGRKAGGEVEILEGIRPGERVVTRGAHLIRLASLSNQVPAHGHVH